MPVNTLAARIEAVRKSLQSKLARQAIHETYPDLTWELHELERIQYAVSALEVPAPTPPSEEGRFLTGQEGLKAER